MSGLGLGVFLAIGGLLAATLVGRHLSAHWAPGAIGGISGGFGIGALHVSGHGHLELPAFVILMIVYGLLVGLAARLGQRMGAQR